MTTPTTQPDKITAQELRDQFAALHEEIQDLRADIETLRAGLQAAATASPAATMSQVQTFGATELILGYNDRGEPTYKAKGIPFTKFGVRVWPETLPALGIDPSTLKPGPNPIDMTLCVQMITTTGEDGQPRTVPQKVIGKVS
jgi:hypothetical protein